MITSFDDFDKTHIESDFLKEYIVFKEQNPDSIILMQIGTFFEALFEDAKILSDSAGINTGTRQVKGLGKVIQAGIPQDSIEFYIKLLVNKNFKICLCPQYSDENGNKYRKISRKYTKGTIIEKEFLDSSENNHILALYKNDDIYELAYADVSTGQFYKTSSIEYQEILIEVDKVSPSEILILNTQSDYFKGIGLKYNVSMVSADKTENLKSENLILDYCKLTQKKFVVGLDNVIEYKINDFLSMDEITRFDLELTRTKRQLKKKGSLFWFLNYTKTPMGARLLKRYMNEPLLVEDLIKQRQIALDELIKDKNNLEKIGLLMLELCDLSRISARISNTTILPKDLYTIVDNLEAIRLLNDIISKYSSPLLKINSKNYENILELAGLIKKAIKEDCGNDIMSGGIINEGFDFSLDSLRTSENKIDIEISEYETFQKKQLKIDKLKVNYTRQNGYFIEIPKSKENLLDLNYFKKNSSNTVSRFTTDKLKELEKQKNSIVYKINQLEYELFCEIRRQASGFVQVVRAIAKDIARLDVLYSFAKCAEVNKLTCPSFNENGICIKNGFHPSLLKLNNEITKNDTSLKNGQAFIVTGANMSGKSTYLKHNAIIVLLSQMGSFVPADCADVKICDKIFLRQSVNDDLINNNSSFMVEMNDLKFILDNATSNSLVLLDEPAKSTTSAEGGAIARAFIEYLMKNNKSKTIVATHNLELTKIENKFPDTVINWQIGLNNEFSRKLVRGVAKSSNALNTAKLAQLPDEIIKNAKKYL